MLDRCTCGLKYIYIYHNVVDNYDFLCCTWSMKTNNIYINLGHKVPPFWVSLIRWKM